MEVVRYEDPAAFRHDGAQVLLANPARNNLPLSILQVLQDQPEVYPTFHLWMAAHDGRPQGLAMQTEPFNVLVAEPLEEGAVDALAEAVVGDAGWLPGVTANVPWVDRFAERVTAMTGREAERILTEGVWELRTVADVPTPGGSARPATSGDRDLLLRWIRAFSEEALPAEHPRDEARTDLEIDLRLAGHGGGYWIWENDTAVSLSGYRDVPGVGSRIGPVYTPPQARHRGYATRLVAELSAARLALGDPACYLFTDMANPTSNSVYARIGYVKVCEAVEFAFRWSTQQAWPRSSSSLRRSGRIPATASERGCLTADGLAGLLRRWPLGQRPRGKGTSSCRILARPLRPPSSPPR